MRFERAMFVAMLTALLCGCKAAPRAESLCARLPAEARNGARFWAELAAQPVATNDDALHALILFLDDDDGHADYAARLESLKSRGVLTRSFDAPPDEAVGRGTIASAIARMLGIRGGLTMSLLGPSPRYAIRELEFLSLFPLSTPNQILTGGELVAILDRMHSYVFGDPAVYPVAATRADMKGRGKIAVPHQVQPVALQTLPTRAVDEPLFMSIDLTLHQPTTTTVPTSLPSGTFVITQIEAKRAEVKLSPDGQFVPCVVGMRLSADSSIRTDLKGLVWIESEGKQFRINGATSVRIASIVSPETGALTTDIEMPNGSINHNLERGGPSGGTTLRSPNSTLAVRGTEVSLYEQRGFAPRALSLTGAAEFENFRRQRVMFGKPNARVGANTVTVTGDTPDPAAVTFAQTIIDPTLRGARSDSEQQLVAQLLSRGAVVGFDRNSGLLIVRGGNVPTDFSPFLGGGAFDVALSWRSDANLNLGVASPGTDNPPARPAEFVYPSAGLTRTPNGGNIRFDHRGGKSGGYEVVSFQRFDNGAYGIVVENVKPKSQQPISATFRVFLDGQPAPFTVNDDFFNSVTEFTIDVGPGSPSVTIIDSVGSEFQFPFSASTKSAKRKQDEPAPFVGPVRPANVGPQKPINSTKSSKSTKSKSTKR